ncbi:hypothetical protein H9Y04_28185 [Streptomyces sp. TRM66268-LWL]|uniref:Integral membrane protein n=1 Tax=Streptomyces polyasparticus TaxID=2767826 RepID=A0ABR7SLW6_9ACTN|nr:hypothetical protein [Streptomyces polyasparticus]MBC9716418.1 hypothetical protein [Streptomyces polyasparticus]
MRPRRLGAVGRRLRVRATWLDPRRSVPALWKWACGEPYRTQRPRRTPEFLRERRVLVPALALLLFALTAGAYFDVHGRTDQVRNRLTPALTGLAEARVQLHKAQDEAVRRFGPFDRETVSEQPGQVAIGELYETLLSRAGRALDGAGRSGALDARQTQQLGIVQGLVRSYSKAISMADQNRENPGMRKAGVNYGADILCDRAEKTLQCTPLTAQHGEPIALLGRIAALEAELRQETRDQPAALTPLLLALLTLPAAALLAVVLAGTLRFCRLRLRLISAPLWALLGLAAAVYGLLAAGALEEHAAQRDVRTQVQDLSGSAPEQLAGRGGEITDTLDEAGPVGWAQTARIALGVGTAGAVSAGLALYSYGLGYPSAGRRAGA